MRVPRMNDSPAASIAFWLASDIMPASATTVTSVSWWAAMNALITGSIVAVSALLPSNASTVSGNPVASVSSPMVICGSRRRSLENPGSRNPSPVSVSKYSVRHVVEHQRRRPERGVRGARRRQCLARQQVWRTPAGDGSASRYDGRSTPASASTRSESTLLVGSMIRASTSSRNTSSPPVAASKPSTS